MQYLQLRILVTCSKKVIYKDRVQFYFDQVNSKI